MVCSWDDGQVTRLSNHTCSEYSNMTKVGFLMVFSTFPEELLKGGADPNTIWLREERLKGSSLVAFGLSL